MWCIFSSKQTAADECGKYYKRHQSLRTTLLNLISPGGLLVLSANFAILLLVLVKFRSNQSRLLNTTPPLPQVDVSVLASEPKKAVIDVVSIGSNSRWEYVEAQLATWASDESIRNFEGISEDHHESHGGCDDVMRSARECNTFKSSVRRQPPTMHRHDFFMHNSEGWLCAQKRPAIALGDVIANKYVPRGREELPDWLLLVDDDSIFHMDVFKISVSDLLPDDVHVMAGSLIFPETLAWPYGGNGVALSRGAVRRLLTPLDCQTHTTANTTDFERYACQTLHRNRAYELDNFVNGMSIADLMLNMAEERKPLCWHSDWMTGWFFSNYILMGWTIPRFPMCPAPYDCQPTNEAIKNCGHFLLVCHYQTPEMMRADYSRI